MINIIDYGLKFDDHRDANNRLDGWTVTSTKTGKSVFHSYKDSEAFIQERWPGHFKIGLPVPDGHYYPALIKHLKLHAKYTIRKVGYAK